MGNRPQDHQPLLRPQLALGSRESLVVSKVRVSAWEFGYLRLDLACASNFLADYNKWAGCGWRTFRPKCYVSLRLTRTLRGCDLNLNAAWLKFKSWARVIGDQCRRLWQGVSL